MSEMTISVDGTKRWYQNARLHREYGPAIEYTDGSYCWLRNGRLHRENGPARRWPSGLEEWWLDGIFIRDNKLSKAQVNWQQEGF